MFPVVLNYCMDTIMTTLCGIMMAGDGAFPIIIVQSIMHSLIVGWLVVV